MTTSLPQQKDCAQHGFTLVELMITVLISMIIILAIGTSYISQQRSQVAQDQVVEMQQNGRALMAFLSSEIRLAGYGTSASDAGLTTATKNQLSFTHDRGYDGTTSGSDEAIDYGFRAADDPDKDGIIANGEVAPFCRRRANVDDAETGWEELTNNIGAIEFLYVLTNDLDTPVYDAETTLTPALADYSKIRAVKISILARAERPDQRFTDTFTYEMASGAKLGPFNDHFRRRMLITTVQLRNSQL